MHLNVLTPRAKELYPTLSAFKEDFYLAGGTGLALQIGHRVSVDFDLFSGNPIKRTLLREVERLYIDQSKEILVSTKDELTLLLGGVKCTFLHYPFPVLEPLTASGPVPILVIKEILAAKAYTIGRRGEFKDYVDLYCGLHAAHATLPELTALARKKYGEAFNDRLFLEQLVYLDDVEETELTMFAEPVPRKEQLLDFFSALLKKEALQ